MKTLISAVAPAALLLTGCSADAEPQFETPATSSPTATLSATATVTATAAPEPWEEKSPEGAVAFAKHWTATFSEAFQTGDTGELKTLSNDKCESCTFLIDTVDQIYSTGGSAEGEAWTFTQVASAPPSADGKSVAVTGIMRIPALTIRRASGRVEREPQVSTRFNFSLEWADGWQIERLVRQS